MSLTASVSIPLSTVPAEYVVNCEILVSNSSSNSITLTDIEPQIKSTPISFLEDKSSWTASPISLQCNPVPANGSQTFLLRVIFHGSNRNNSTNVPIYSTYDLGCIVYSSDGQVITPTPVTITVLQNTGGK